MFAAGDKHRFSEGKNIVLESNTSPSFGKNKTCRSVQWETVKKGKEHAARQNLEVTREGGKKKRWEKKKEHTTH